MHLTSLFYNSDSAWLIEQGLTSTKHIIGHIGDDFYRSYDQTNSAGQCILNKSSQ